MDPRLKKNLSSSEYWLRALYTFFFILCAEIAGTLILVVAIGQILFTLITGQPNPRLINFGDSLAQYLFAIFKFVTCKSEEKPFPFADWPVSEPVEIAVLDEMANGTSEDPAVATDVVKPAQNSEPILDQELTPENSVKSEQSSKKAAAPKKTKAEKNKESVPPNDKSDEDTELTEKEKSVDA
jgi:hypothetical protein